MGNNSSISTQCMSRVHACDQSFRALFPSFLHYATKASVKADIIHLKSVDSRMFGNFQNN